MSRIYIGCSGFSYKDWSGNFYPEDVKNNEWLSFYAKHFDTLELNVTFYRLPQVESFENWYNATPANFSFAVKGSRYITHRRKMNDAQEILPLFFERVFTLKEKLKVILWQFPPNFRKNTERLEQFLQALQDYNIRNAFEFRHESWICSEISELLKKYKSSLCLADWPPFLDIIEEPGEFVYIRRHGSQGKYNTCYSAEELQSDAERIKKYQEQGKDVYIYFNNDVQGFAPKNAIELKEILLRPLS